MLAAFPTMKFPDQNIVVRIKIRYAKLLLFFTKLIKSQRTIGF